MCVHVLEVWGGYSVVVDVSTLVGYDGLEVEVEAALLVVAV